MRKVDSPEAGAYVLRLNTDNKWLRNEIKRLEASDTETESLTNEFGAVMASLAMSIMATPASEEPTSGGISAPSADDTSRDVGETIDWFTKAAAPIVASMRSFVGLSHDSQGEPL